MSSKLFENKVVIVTGAGGGIGRAEARAFAKEGAKVVVNDVGGSVHGAGSDDSVAAKVVEEIRAAGGEAVASHASVADLDGAESVVWTALNKFKSVDILVNNAGILRDRMLTNMSVAEWDAVLDVHLKGSFLMTRAFARAKKVLGTPGAVVNTTSLAGISGNVGQANYSAAKAGLMGLTQTTNIELSRMGIRCNAVAPVALTRMTEDIPILAEMGVASMRPEHIATVVTWLASDLAADVSGRIFGVHGEHVFEYAVWQSEGMTKAPGDDGWTPESLQQNLSGIALKR